MAKEESKKYPSAHFFILFIILKAKFYQQKYDFENLNLLISRKSSTFASVI